MQRNETSSMQLFDVKRVGKLCSKYNSNLIVDAISSFAIDPYNMDDFNVSATILSSQKGLGLFPGLAMIVLNKEISKQKLHKRNYYLDLDNYLGDYKDLTLPFTPNLIVLKQLNHKLNSIKDIKMENIIKGVNEQATHFRELIGGLPLEIRTETLSNCGTLLYTEKKDVKDFFRKLQKKEIYFTPSGGEEGKKFCVSHLKYLTKEDNLVFIGELKKWLKD